MTQNMEAPALETDKEPGFPENTAEIYRQAKRIIEGILFCSNEPISLRRMKNALEAFHPLGKDEVLRLVKELGEEYETQDRAFRLEEIAKGYLLRTSEEINPYILSLIKNTRPERLSHAAAEVLAIVAFRQPITRPQIDEIRGVDCSGIIYSLLERQLIEPVGKMEVPGRPTLFGVTNNFLKHFGLKDLKDLPKISESKPPHG
ncbi:MAG: SMC-Scp complex subunit ScpB [Waddliaceae bacterium]